jgi:hypothetical protein
MVLPVTERQGPIEAWIIDDTVGVAMVIAERIEVGPKIGTRGLVGVGAVAY